MYPGRLTAGKTDAPVQLRNRGESAMRGLGYDAHIERGVASSMMNIQLVFLIWLLTS